MEKNCPTISVTIITKDKAAVSAIHLANNRPAIFEAKILTEPSVIDGVSGLEGELMLSSINKDNIGSLDADGNLLITTEDDDAKNYYLENLDLKYDDK